MLKLNVKTLRDTRSKLLWGLGITAGVAFWVAFFSAYNMALDSARYSFLKIRQDLHLADLQVITDVVDKDQRPNLEGIPGVTTTQKRLIDRGEVVTPAGKRLPVIMIYDEAINEAPINTLQFIKGENLSEEDLVADTPRVIIDRTMLILHGLDVGDRMELTRRGWIDEVEVKGVVLTPEFIFPGVDPDLMVSQLGSVGIVYLSMNEIVKLFGYPLYNLFSFVFDPGHESRKLEENLYERLSDIGVAAFVPKRATFDEKVYTRTFILPIEKAAPTIFFVLGFTLFILISFSAYRLIKEKWRQITICLAMGAPRWKMVSYVFKIALIYVLLGCVSGVVLSSPLTPLLVALFTEPLHVTEVFAANVPRADLWLPLKGFVYCLLFSLLAVAIPSWKIGSFSSQDIVRPERSRAVFSSFSRFFGRQRLFEGITRSLFPRYAVRALVRRPYLTGLTILSISLAFALAGCWNVFFSSIIGTMHRGFDRAPWSLMLDLRRPVHANAIHTEVPLDLLGEYEAYLSGMALVQFDDERHFVKLTGIEREGRIMRTLPLVQGRGFSSDHASELILNANHWRGKPLDIGQKVRVETPEGGEVFRLVGLVNEYALGIEYAYLPLGTTQRVLGRPGVYSGLWAFSRHDMQRVRDLLVRSDAVERVITKQDIHQLIENHFHTVRSGVRGIQIGAMVLAPILLFVTVSLSITEREREFVVLRAMGVRPEGVWKILLWTAISIGVLGALLSIPCTILLGLAINSIYSNLYFPIEMLFVPMDFNYVLIGLFLFPLVAWVFARRIIGLNLASKLKERTS